MANPNPAHVVLRNVRLSYVHLDQPYSQNSGDNPKYSVVVLVPKQPGDNRARIDAAIQAATQRAREKFGQAFPVQPKISVHDGDGVRPSDGQPFGEECRGCWVFTASSRTRPSIVDRNMQPILDPTQLYSGIYANIGVTFFGYNAPQNKGIGVALDNVQKVADGEPLGGARASAEDDFTALPQEEPPFTGYASQPVSYGQPAQPPAPVYGQQQTALPPFYSQQPPAPVYGQPATAYGQAAPQPVYGQAYAVNPFTGQPQEDPAEEGYVPF